MIAGGTLPSLPDVPLLPEVPGLPEISALPEVPGLPNFRDVGGHPTRDGGRVRTGLLYRSTDLARIDEAGAATLAGLGIRTVYDLRTAGERSGGPDRVPAAAAYVVADVLGDSRRMTPADFGPIFEDPATAERELGGGRAALFFVEAYREFVSLPSARDAYGRLFAGLAGGAPMPALFHCTTGKDRTGWAAAALLLFVGVPEDIVLDDYLASGPRLRPMAQPFFDAFAARGGDVGLLEPLMDVRVAYLDSALDEMTRRFGSIEGYVADGLGLDGGTRDALRAILVEPA